jgi:hypothetical protein
MIISGARPREGLIGYPFDPEDITEWLGLDSRNETGEGIEKGEKDPSSYYPEESPPADACPGKGNFHILE